MSSLKQVNPNADTSKYAFAMNVNAATALAEVLQTSLGPKGTLKMLVSGSGDIKLTKDGNTLLHEMQIQHPCASLIARTATAQDDICGDGTTTAVILIGELLKLAARLVGDGLHPRVISEGYELAKEAVLELIDERKLGNGPPSYISESVEATVDESKPDEIPDRETLLCIARSTLRTKLTPEMAQHLATICVDSCLCIRQPRQRIDLFMIEVQTMMHRTESDTRLVRGLVLDHGTRHPDMPKRLENAFVLTLNCGLEYEKSEINAGMHYTSAKQRKDMAEKEHMFVDKRVEAIIKLKNEVCTGENADNGFLVVNQKGIDPLALDMLARAGIMGLRRAKRRNMERLTLACGGVQQNAVDDLKPDCLGYAGLVYEHVLGEEKFTFVEKVKNPRSVTVLIRGSAKHHVQLIKDSVRDGVRAVKNAIEDGALLPGAGAFFVSAAEMLTEKARTVKGRASLAVATFGEALLIIPKTLAVNGGNDALDALLAVREEQRDGNHNVGVDCVTGDAIDAQAEGIYDCVRVVRQLIQGSAMIATQLLLVDEIIAAGKTNVKSEQMPSQAMGGMR